MWIPWWVSSPVGHRSRCCPIIRRVAQSAVPLPTPTGCWVSQCESHIPLKSPLVPLWFESFHLVRVSSGFGSLCSHQLGPHHSDWSSNFRPPVVCCPSVIFFDFPPNVGPLRWALLVPIGQIPMIYPPPAPAPPPPPPFRILLSCLPVATWRLSDLVG